MMACHAEHDFKEICTPNPINIFMHGASGKANTNNSKCILKG